MQCPICGLPMQRAQSVNGALPGWFCDHIGGGTLFLPSEELSPDKLPDAVREQIDSLTSNCLNEWLSTTRGLPITLQLTKLGFAMIAMLEAAHRQWRADWHEEQYDKGDSHDSP